MTPEFPKEADRVALPLDAINKASARKIILWASSSASWWYGVGPRRGRIFAQMVDDPSSHPDIFKTDKRRRKTSTALQDIEDLVRGRTPPTRKCWTGTS
jgi:putative DNA methylase